MFDYAVRALRMSEAEAYPRIQTARLGRQFPRVLELLGSGALHLTTIKLLAAHLTPDNHVQLLERARGKSKREVEQLVASIAPKPDVPNQLRKLPQPLGTRTCQPQLPQSLGSHSQPQLRGSLGSHTSQSQLPGSLHAADVTGPASSVRTDDAGVPKASPERSAAAAVAALPRSAEARANATHALHAQAGLATFDAAATSVQPSLETSGVQQSSADAVCLAVAADSQKPAFALQMPRSRASCTPLRPGRYKLQLSVGQEVHDKLEQLQELLRHRVPDGDLARIVELAVDGLFDKTLKQRFAQSAVANKRPRGSERAFGHAARAPASKKAG